MRTTDERLAMELMIPLCVTCDEEPLLINGLSFQRSSSDHDPSMHLKTMINKNIVMDLDLP